MEFMGEQIEIEIVLTFISILVIVITFLIEYHRQRRSVRRERTNEFLHSIIKDEGLIHEANLEFAIWIREDREFKNDVVNSETDKIIMRLLDFYDLISDAAIKGVVDKEMIVIHLGGRMRSAYELLENYIHDRRKKLRRCGLYKPFEDFVKHHIGDRDV